MFLPPTFPIGLFQNLTAAKDKIGRQRSDKKKKVGKDEKLKAVPIKSKGRQLGEIGLTGLTLNQQFGDNQPGNRQKKRRQKIGSRLPVAAADGKVQKESGRQKDALVAGQTS